MVKSLDHWTHYVEISIPRDLGLVYETHARILTAVHFSISEGADLAINWPDFKSDVQGYFGLRARIFSNGIDGLTSALQHLRKLESYKLVLLSEIMDVPKEATNGVRFVRNAKAHHSYPSRYKKLVAYNKLKGFEPPPPFDVWQREKLNSSKHRLYLQSASNKSVIVMHIAVLDESDKSINTRGGSYGLSHETPMWGAK